MQVAAFASCCSRSWFREVSDDARLELVEEAVAKVEHLPQGELVLRLVDLQNDERVLSVGFEYSGKLTQPTEPVEINIPAELLEGYALKLLDSDGTETELPFTVTEDTATFTLNFDASTLSRMKSPSGRSALCPFSDYSNYKQQDLGGYIAHRGLCIGLIVKEVICALPVCWDR